MTCGCRRRQDLIVLGEALIHAGVCIEELVLPNHRFGDNGARGLIRLLQVWWGLLL